MRTAETQAKTGLATASQGRIIGRWLMGGLLVAAGALSGAFGAVAWLEALRMPSFLLALVGIVLLGIVPIIIGLGLVWTGLGVLEEPVAPQRAVSDDALLQATRQGATRDEVRLRIGRIDAVETERRLDDLVVRELLELEVTDEGQLVYRPRVHEPLSLG
jgi:hypothetical protein